MAIDTAAASALPGVRAVLVGADLDDIDPFYGVAVKDQPILAIDVVRYSGEPVAAVAADDPETAGRALELIVADYEDLPAVHSLDEALAPAAPLVHNSVRMAAHFRDLAAIKGVSGTNILHHYEYRLGDAAAGFQSADRVFDAVYEVPAVAHCALEPLRRDRGSKRRRHRRVFRDAAPVSREKRALRDLRAASDACRGLGAAHRRCIRMQVLHEAGAAWRSAWPERPAVPSS